MYEHKDRYLKAEELLLDKIHKIYDDVDKHYGLDECQLDELYKTIKTLKYIKELNIHS